jgi:lysophospholipase L1-like esterase
MLRGMRRSTRILLAASLALNLAAGVAVAVRLLRRLSPPHSSARIYREHRLSLLEALPGSEGGIVFLGDSLTEHGEWSELLGVTTAMNRGIGEDTTRDVLARVQQITAMKPATVFLLIGCNDLIEGRPVAEIAADYRAIVRALGPAVVVESVLPVNTTLIHEPLDNAQIAALNGHIRAIAAEAGVRYVDVGAALSDAEGQLDRRFTSDGLHLNGAGYRRFREALLPYLPGRAPPRGGDAR